MESSTPQNPMALALQIQMLTTNIEELTRQNQQMRQQLQQEENCSPTRVEINRNEDKEISHRRDGSRRMVPSDRASNDLLKSMRKEMVELKNSMKEKTNKNLDKMVEMIDYPFTTKVLECLLPTKFCLPQLESYDGLKDPMDHITTFKMTLSL